MPRRHVSFRFGARFVIVQGLLALLVSTALVSTQRASGGAPPSPAVAAVAAVEAVEAVTAAAGAAGAASAAAATTGGTQAVVPASSSPRTLAELQRLFDAPPDDSRIMMRWWWFGPAVTKPRLARELQLMKEGGIGGVEIQPVYPVALDDEATGIKNMPFLSDEFLDALRFASETAHDLGLRVDLTLGSGWPFGGPQVPIAEAAGRLRHERIAIPPGATRVPRPDLAGGERLVALFVARTASGSTPASSARGGPATGGPATDGPAPGGPATGGPATGRPAPRGPATGGPATGGPATGGPATGGSATGGSATGGSGAGGSGGRGSAAAGSTASGSTSGRSAPLGSTPTGAVAAGSVQPAAERTRARDAGQAAEIAIVPDSVRQIPIEVADGMIRVPPSSGDQLLVFIASRTGMMVKRAAVGSEGYVLDHYDRAALDRYLKEVGDRLMKGFGPRPPFAIFCDSLEVFASDWTGDLLPAFQQRRGYDLTPHLPALVADLGPKTAAIRHDWGRTLTELLDERFLAPMQSWAREHRTRVRVQGYGMPPATLSSNALADLPEGEGWQWRTLTSARWAASASHLYGRPVSSSETWTWLHSPSFRATPLDMKMEADLHFLQGVTQLIGHGWPYTADGVEDPGWRFYAAGVFNDRNPWWIVMPEVSRYLQRVSFMLRQGTPANDVALYLPNSDAWASFSAGRVHMLEVLRDHLGPHILGDIFDAGFNLDFFDDAALHTAGRVDGKALVLGQNRHAIVVLPGVERMPIETLRTLDAFARGGGTVIATRRLPALAPGFRATDVDHAEVRDVARRLFTGAGAPGRFVADERQLGAALAAARRPDVLFSPAAPEIGIVHRRTPFADIYFLANTANVAKRAAATFRASRAHAAWWDPMSGRMTPADLTRSRGSEAGSSTTIELEPYGSRLIVFTDQPASTSPGSMTSASSTASTASTLSPRVTPANVSRPSASASPSASSSSAPSAASAAFTAAPTLDLNTGWTVTFGSRTPPVTFDRLRSWTDDEATRDFSGTATYERTVTIPADYRKTGRALWLDFGETTPVTPTQGRSVRQQAWVAAPIREAAVVYIDDTRAGALWAPPYALDVTALLPPGTHRLRVVVANLAINRMAARPLPSYRLLNLRYGVRFEPQDMDNLQPLPAGLLGPVRLRAIDPVDGARPAPR